MKALFEVEVCI